VQAHDLVAPALACVRGIDASFEQRLVVHLMQQHSILREQEI
jgi:hypothetical protein